MNNSQPNEKKHNYFYKITNLINGKYYYGIRSTDKEIEKDKYFGSGKAIQEAIKKYGKENFQKEIIADYPTRKEVSEHEVRIVTFELIQLEECYNCRTGGVDGYVFTEDIINKMRQPRKNLSEESRFLMGSPWRGAVRSDEFKANLSEKFSGPRNPSYGIPKSEETKKKLSERMSGENHPFFGQKRPPEVVEKVRNSNRGKKRTPEQNKKMSELRKGIRTKPGKPCSIDGVRFDYMVDIARQYNISQDTVTKRVRSLDWLTWYYITDDNNDN